MPISSIGIVDNMSLLTELKSIDWNKQTMLQTVKGKNADGTGRIANLKFKEEEYDQPLHDLPYLNHVMNHYNLKRTRLLNLRPGDCYSYHVDPTKRIHIPLVADEYCMAVIEDKVYRLPADGTVYLVDTTKRHTFLNGGDYDRLHIVGVAPHL